MNKRQKIGLIISISFFSYTVYTNYGLVRDGHEIWWFAIIMQFVMAGLCFGLYKAVNQKTFREQYEERFPNNKREV